MGRVKYLENILKDPKSIVGSDRMWMTLSYNVGLGHLEDARIITERFGHNQITGLMLKTSSAFKAEKILQKY